MFYLLNEYQYFNGSTKKLLCRSHYHSSRFSDFDFAAGLIPQWNCGHRSPYCPLNDHEPFDKAQSERLHLCIGIYYITSNRKKTSLAVGSVSLDPIKHINFNRSCPIPRHGSFKYSLVFFRLPSSFPHFPTYYWKRVFCPPMYVHMLNHCNDIVVFVFLHNWSYLVG